MTITEEQITAALRAYANERDGRWQFRGSYDPRTGLPHFRSEEEARGIVRGCLVLGTPVTDTVTADAWLAVIDTVVGLQQQLAELTEWRNGQETYAAEQLERET